MAKKFAKWIAGGLGWAFGGPIGAALGFALGTMFDNTELSGEQGEQNNASRVYGRKSTGPDDFIRSLLVLAAAVVKADGKIERSELEFVKQFFVKQFGAHQAQDILLVFNQILQVDIPLKEVCEQIRLNMDHPSRLQLVHFLFNIAAADGNVDSTELHIIARIAPLLGISKADYDSMKAMFYKDKKAAYTILELEETCSDDDIKKAYRKMALKYHPDKIAHLGEDFKKSAEDKFLKVQEAYEELKKQRGI